MVIACPGAGVTLTEGVPGQDAASGQGAVLLGRELRRDVAQRSELLAGISDTRGVAALPAHLSPEDVDLWQAACLVSTTMSAAELAAVAKVADALGDSGIHNWIDKLATQVLATSWSDSAASTPMLCSLLQLPSHLLHRVLHACLATGTTSDDLLGRVPFPLVPHIISAAAATGSLTLSSINSDMFLVHVAAMPPPSPALTSFHIAHDLSTSSVATAALLARALAAHPSLTSLDFLATVLPPAHLREFNGIVRPSTLPNLTTLRVSTFMHPDGCIMLAGMLKQLPSLSEATIYVACDQEAPARATPLSAYLRAAASPARLPLLHKLVLREYQCADNSQWQNGMQPAHHQCIHLLLPLIEAPALTDLRIRSDAVTIDSADFLRPLCSFCALHTLRVDADAIFGALTGSGWEYDQRGGCLRDVAAFCFPRLHTLHVRSAAAVAPATIAAAIAARAQSSLTRLSMHHSHCGPFRRVYASADTKYGVRPAWQGLWAALRQCCLLRHLDLGSFMHGSGGILTCPIAEDLDCVSGALMQLTQLTHLTLMPKCADAACAADLWGAPFLEGAALGSVLRPLKNLRTLAIGAAAPATIVEQPDLFTALRQLSELSAVRLSIFSVQLEALAASLQTMAQVSSLLLHPASFADGGLLDLPACLTRIEHLQVCVSEYDVEQIAS